MEENKTFGLSSFWLKIIAIVFMTLDHVIFVWHSEIDPSVVLYLRSLGRITFPVMVFLLTEGYVYTSNRIKYAGRLFVFALISMIPFYILHDKPWDVMFTLFVGLVLLIIKDECVVRFKQVDEKLWLVLFLFIAAAISWFMNTVDWGFPGVLAIYAGGQVKDIKLRVLMISGVLFGGSIFEVVVERALVVSDVVFYGGIALSAIVLLLYNGELGYAAKGKMKYAFYIYYPLHLFVIAMVWWFSEQGFAFTFGL